MRGAAGDHISSTATLRPTITPMIRLRKWQYLHIFGTSWFLIQKTTYIMDPSGDIGQ
jgi:hypothetical protein